MVDTHPTTSARMHRSPDRSREYAADGEVMRRMLLDRLGSTAALEEIVDHFNLTKKVVGGWANHAEGIRALRGERHRGWGARLLLAQEDGGSLSRLHPIGVFRRLYRSRNLS